MTLDDALDRFLTQLRADGRSVHTRRQYRRHVRLFAAWWRDVGAGGDVGAVSHEDVARFLASREARTRRDGGEKKATTVNTLRSSLRGFFGYLHRAGYIAADPTRLVRRAMCATPPPHSSSRSSR